MAKKTIKKFFGTFLGEDFSFSDITRPAQFLALSQNSVSHKNGDVGQRQGALVDGGNGVGSVINVIKRLMTYVYNSRTNAETKQELLRLSSFTQSALSTFVEKKTVGKFGMHYGTQDIKIQRGSITFGASSDTDTWTIPEPVASFGSGGSAFVRITNVFHVAARDSATSSDLNNDDIGVTLQITDLDEVTATRESGGENVDYVVEFEIWEYVGVASGPNEFIVRNQAVATVTTTSHDETVLGISNVDDVVVFHGGVRSDLTTSTPEEMANRLTVGDFGAGNKVRIITSAVTGNTRVAYSVVEFTGSNWSVEQVDHTFTDDGVTEVETISDVGDWSNAFIVKTSNSLSSPGTDELLDVVWPGEGSTQLNFRATTGSSVSGRVATAFVVKNSAMHVGHAQSELVEPSSSISYIENVNDSISVMLDESNGSVIVYMNSSDANQDVPKGLFNYSLDRSGGGGYQFLQFQSGRSGGVSPWVLQQITMPRATKSGNVGDVAFAPNSSNEWNLTLREDGSDISGFPVSFGSQFPTYSSSVTIQEFFDAINDTDDFSIFLMSPALYPSAYNPQEEPAAVLGLIEEYITLDASINEFQYTYWDAVEGLSLQGDPKDKDFILPSYINTNDVLLMCSNSDFPYKYDGRNVHRAGLPKPGYSPVFISKSSGELTGEFDYYFFYKRVDNVGNVIEGPLSDPLTLTLDSEKPFFIVPGLALGVMIGQVDGTQSSTTEITCVFIDQRVQPGDVIRYYDGTIGDQRTVTLTEVDRTNLKIKFSSGFTVNVPDLTRLYCSELTQADGSVVSYDGFDAFVLSANGTQSNTNLISVRNLPENPQTAKAYWLDERIYFLNSATGDYEERTVINFDTEAHTIEISGDPVDVSDGIQMSNIRAVIVRTKAGGELLYVVREVPVAGKSLSGLVLAPNQGADAGYTDLSVDEELQVKYLEPLREPEPPPSASFIIEHQGLVIYAGHNKSVLEGDIPQPNSLFFAEPGKPEAVPRSTNVIDIPFTTEGPITGLGVDSGALVVFKARGRAYIQGDLASDAFTIQVEEDGIGCVSHDSIQRTPVGLVWLSHTGFQRSVLGQLDPAFNAVYYTFFENQQYDLPLDNEAVASENESKLVPKFATAINDYRNSRYICFVPAFSTTSGLIANDSNFEPNENSAWFVYEYDYGRWSRWPCPTYMNAKNGFAIYKNELYRASYHHGGAANVQRMGLVWKETNRGDKYDAIDNVEGIDWKLRFQWDHAGEPSVPTKFNRVRFWLSNPSLLISSFSLAVKTYLNFNFSSAHSQAVKSFTTSTKKQIFKPKPAKADAISIELSNDTQYEAPRITGYEYEILLPYNLKIEER